MCLPLNRGRTGTALALEGFTNHPSALRHWRRFLCLRRLQKQTFPFAGPALVKRKHNSMSHIHPNMQNNSKLLIATGPSVMANDRTRPMPRPGSGKAGKTIHLDTNFFNMKIPKHLHVSQSVHCQMQKMFGPRSPLHSLWTGTGLYLQGFMNSTNKTLDAISLMTEDPSVMLRERSNETVWAPTNSSPLELKGKLQLRRRKKAELRMSRLK